MDTVAQYRRIICEILAPYGKVRYAGMPDVNNQVIFDTERDHYLVVSIGWEGEVPVYDCIFHVDIIDGKIWVQQDNTDVDLPSLLMEAGIPQKDIALGFQAPSMQKYSSFHHA